MTTNTETRTLPAHDLKGGDVIAVDLGRDWTDGPSVYVVGYPALTRDWPALYLHATVGWTSDPRDAFTYDTEADARTEARTLAATTGFVEPDVFVLWLDSGCAARLAPLVDVPLVDPDADSWPF